MIAKHDCIWVKRGALSYYSLHAAERTERVAPQRTVNLLEVQGVPYRLGGGIQREIEADLFKFRRHELEQHGIGTKNSSEWGDHRQGPKVRLIEKIGVNKIVARYNTEIRE